DEKGNEKTERQSAETASIHEKMAQLQKKFNINFGEAGTQIEEKDSKKILDLRPPTAAELNVLENALTKFAHLARKNGSDFEGLKFHFISAKGNGVSVSEHGWQA